MLWLFFAKRTSWNILKFSHSWIIIIIIIILHYREKILNGFVYCIKEHQRASMQHSINKYF